MKRKLFGSTIVSFVLAGCTGIPAGLTPVTGFEPARYMGKWYEIARLDHRFERHMTNVSAVYTEDEKGRIVVVNRGYHENEKEWKQIAGKARFIENENIGSLKVSFFGPFYGGYHIIALDRRNYQYAMVCGPKRSYLWILSRTKSLDRQILADLVSQAGKWGFETESLIYVKHN